MQATEALYHGTIALRPPGQAPSVLRRGHGLVLPATHLPNNPDLRFRANASA